MKVALLTAKPNWSRKVDGHKLYVGEKRPPHGIGFLTAVLERSGAQVDVFDRYCGDKEWPRDDFASYDLMGLYCTSVCTDDIAYVVKRSKAPRIAVGGPHAHCFPDQIPAKVSHIVRGEAEHIICDLAAGRIEDRIIEPKRLTSQELDALPRFPFERFFGGPKKKLYDWGFHFHEVTPVLTMNTSRGCPYSCSFCSVSSIWGNKLTVMSARRVFDDVRYVVSLGARGVYFREDNFTARRSRLVELCELLARSNEKVLWACETRVDTVDDELMGLMRAAGCIGFYVGVEHLSQRMLDLFRKGVTVEQILAFFESTHKRGIFTHASFIVDHPEETAEDKKERERLLKVISPSFVVNNTYRENG
jgi:radical SAM superfamily enzyme YgiQ (UPF0313 family)